MDITSWNWLDSESSIRDNQVALVTLLDFRIYFLKDLIRGKTLGCLDGLAACGHCPDGQDGQLVAVYGHGDASRDGRSCHGQMVHTGFVVLFQLAFLLDAEFVLLVDDGHAQITGDDFIAEHRMSANKHMDIPGLECFQKLGALPLLGLRCQQAHSKAQLLGVGLHLLVVLLGKNQCGGHQDSLTTVLPHKDRGQHSNHRFTTTDIAGDQRMDAVTLLGLADDDVNGLLLVCGKRERQRLYESPCLSVVRGSLGLDANPIQVFLFRSA